MSTIIVHGPQGCGKTRHAQSIAALFGCTRIVDDWDGVSPLPRDALALTNAGSRLLPENPRARMLERDVAGLRRTRDMLIDALQDLARAHAALSGQDDPAVRAAHRAIVLARLG